MFSDIRLPPLRDVLARHLFTPPLDSMTHARIEFLNASNLELQREVITGQQAQQAAEQMLRQQTERLAIVAHELNNPLMALCAATTLMSRGTPEMVVRMQAVIARQTAHMTRLIEDLLDVSRVATGKLRLLPGRLDIEATVNLALEGCRADIDRRQQALHLTLPSPAGDMIGDSVRLAQILSNLVGNASKYTPDGGEISVRVERHAENVVFSVADNGIGIAPPALLKVFEPFVQEEHAVSFNHAGLGLGLALVRELVQAHGGCVEAHSDGLGCGSRFTVTIPSG